MSFRNQYCKLKWNRNLVSAASRDPVKSRLSQPTQQQQACTSKPKATTSHETGHANSGTQGWIDFHWASFCSHWHHHKLTGKLSRFLLIRSKQNGHGWADDDENPMAKVVQEENSTASFFCSFDLRMVPICRFDVSFCRRNTKRIARKTNVMF